MITSDWDLADRRVVQAFYLEGTLAIFATGQTESPHHEVAIERGTPSLEAPRFVLTRRRASGFRSESVIPYSVSRLFALPCCPASVVIEHAAGRDSVSVVDLRLHTEPGHAAPVIPYIFPPSATRGAQAQGIATGYSTQLDFRQALQEAIQALPPLKDESDLVPKTIRVVEVGVEEGGVACFHHLFVRVRREQQAPHAIASASPST